MYCFLGEIVLAVDLVLFDKYISRSNSDSDSGQQLFGVFRSSFI
jgi:hypothetical protein